MAAVVGFEPTKTQLQRLVCFQSHLTASEWGGAGNRTLASCFTGRSATTTSASPLLGALMSLSSGLGGWIRTSGLFLPREAVYRADITPRDGWSWLRAIHGEDSNEP